MRNILLVIIFFLLTLSLVEKRKAPAYVEKTSIVFGERNPLTSQNETSINIVQLKTKGPYYLQIKNFAPYLMKVHTGELNSPGALWSKLSRVAIPPKLVKRLENLEFQLNQQSCHMIYTTPTLFNCDSVLKGEPKPISILNVSGNKIEILKVKSQVQNETSIGETGELKEEAHYIVDFEFQLNANFYAIRLKTATSKINTEGVVPNVPTTAGSLLKEVSL